MKISVIVPVYNVEKYLEKCLTSLVNQTFKDMEIIVVNDGSTDNSEKIVKEFMKKYANISYYKKENGGVSDARNYGLRYAKGDYIGFLDNDDYVALDMYEKMYKKITSDDFDFVACDVTYVFPDSERVVETKIKKDTTNIKSLFFDMYPVVWNKLYKRELFRDILFKKDVWYEDVELLYRIIPYVKKVGVIHEAFNYYVQREGSITHKVSDKAYDYIDNMNTIVDFYKEKGFYEQYKKELEFIYVRYVFATFIKTVAGFPYVKYMKAVDDAIKSVNEHFPNYRKNRYFKKSTKGLYLLMFNKRVAKMYFRLKRKSK